MPQSLSAINATHPSVSVIMSLVCPLSRRRISLPVRGRACQHVQVDSKLKCFYQLILAKFELVGNSVHIFSALLKSVKVLNESFLTVK